MLFQIEWQYDWALKFHQLLGKIIHPDLLYLRYLIKNKGKIMYPKGIHIFMNITLDVTQVTKVQSYIYQSITLCVISKHHFYRGLSFQKEHILKHYTSLQYICPLLFYNFMTNGYWLPSFLSNPHCIWQHTIYHEIQHNLKRRKALDRITWSVWCNYNENSVLEV